MLAKVAVFTDVTSARRSADLRCSAGCSGCCHAWLAVSAVEAASLRTGLAALPAAHREVVRERGRQERAREAAGEAPARCALLDDDDRCAVYETRPLVCRTQGHALRYPEGFIPASSIRRKTPNGEETWCPLNYDAAAPEPRDVLDAERVDQLLAVVGARYERARAGVDATVATGQRRFALSELAAAAADEDIPHDAQFPRARAGQDTERQ